MLQLMGAFAQFEREIMLERQKEGIRLAAAQENMALLQIEIRADDFKEIKRWAHTYFGIV